MRDIFPEWALDLGIIKKGPAYFFFKYISNFQNQVADTIGIQSKGNMKYFKKDKNIKKVEVLDNWLTPTKGNEIKT